MRKYFLIDLSNQNVSEQVLQGEELVCAGRFGITKRLLDKEIYKSEPFSPDNLLIYLAGPLAGSVFSNGNRVSVGCKSPLTGGIKEANSGGTFAYAMGKLGIAGFEIQNISSDWVVIHFCKNGVIEFDKADELIGLGVYETAEKLHFRYGNKVSLSLCGPVGEYSGLMAGISFSDIDGRPSRMAARGGVGAVMGSKKVKAVVIDVQNNQSNNRPEITNQMRKYAQFLRDQPEVKSINQLGTIALLDLINHLGALPVRNFSVGSIRKNKNNSCTFDAVGIRNINLSRGGIHEHSCMPGCVVKCSNVITDKFGNEVVSPLEYETIGLLGSNCGIDDPDKIAILNYFANDIGVDSIELGATIGILMNAGISNFGNFEFMLNLINNLRQGTENGRLWSQGAFRVGKHYSVQNVPVIKKQAISAYDPRVIEVTGLSMMLSAQGADHTSGNVPNLKSRDKSLEELLPISLQAQIISATADSLGLCLFGQSVIKKDPGLLIETINIACKTQLNVDFLIRIGKETLLLEHKFNHLSGINDTDDELPLFFYQEPLMPTGYVARFHAKEVQSFYEILSKDL